MKLTTLLLGLTVAQMAWASPFAITASSIQKLGGSLAGIKPAVKTPAGADAYLGVMSCLGYYGPLGPYGPLGLLGPIGTNVWNPSYWISAVGDWSTWSSKLAQLNGPLSEAGPLGPNGPLGQAYWSTLPAINDFCKQLQAGGVWSALGPVGPLGALGPLGPLGPVGAHGFATDSNGRYVKGGVEQRSVSVSYQGSTRTFPLYENYRAEYAQKKTDNDVSFMVEGSMIYGDSHTYKFTAPTAQFVTVLLTPLAQADAFDLIISDAATHKVIASSTETTFINHVVFPAPAGKQLVATVKLSFTGHFPPSMYRLYVTGSTEYIATTDISGKHQIGAPNL
ncbi:hypothetical protein PAPYR_6058 [Paratrimastix pyriformis]|uniref:Uncharacterized protein n=1 Tax=Paratrimastix pyriformis TaxID=342808 RepID=A0ABQ8ULM9_9EUKA|nr:hypothetical protein PAPYR_6058 [Paratrimastix pyriformis]|eukprot:GAFH01002242.1.p1 GENE.GAFH01002242.1~~GAFH01002242.1.p1  ORF type:complete len:336 (-),score=68.65 GAFH01002242.1:183-1190(-)